MHKPRVQPVCMPVQACEAKGPCWARGTSLCPPIIDGLVVVDQTSFGASHSGCIETEGRLLRGHMLAFPAQKLLELASALAYTDELYDCPSSTSLVFPRLSFEDKIECWPVQ